MDLMSVRVAQNWFKRFQSSDFDVKDEPRSSRSVTDKVDAILEKVDFYRRAKPSIRSLLPIADEIQVKKKRKMPETDQ
ncbi:hypothetical protein EVAR_39682_1 [Eumeta japonica]|uniref:Mos1 transposase HTH domain-containing protein n=1 Tax=Eumeta variegata TaxID=151549 RepID=A0A4C1Z781_EUMVA|nr:hypothetical protein EVAR_39682_1 [Eumeta japonica]